MTNFRINFSHPWFLLLLIPAFALTFFSYFKLGKRYRCTRNRIVSMVLHLTVMVLAISVLAGMTFSYYEPNTENEVILLVDASYSTSKDSQDDVDDFIKSVIDNTDEMFKLGIVTFGYNQVYAAELSNDTKNLYQSYLESEKPDTTATDIASALTYAASLLKKPETARIVLLSDAIETDGSAKNIIKSVAALGTKVDTVYFPGKDVGFEVQAIDMIKPDKKIRVNEDFSVTLVLESSYAGNVVITPTDNDTELTPVEKELIEGRNEILLPIKLNTPGMHELSFDVEGEYDEVVENNCYLSYIYIDIFDDVLIIESVENESKDLIDMLNTRNDKLNLTVLHTDDVEQFPKTLNELRVYDEVVLLNVANKDLPAEFDKILYSYVHDFGGGLFTICGNENADGTSESAGNANAYTRDDMYNTLYQEMLPVEIINYTPPAAVMIIIDTSGSMYAPGSDAYDGSKLASAIEGAKACLDALTERDYVGVMTLADSYSEEIEITPRTQRDKILEAITTLEESAINGETGGGTIFSAALERAGKSLSALTDVEKRHIIIVTDGEPTPTDEERYKYWFEQNRDLGITTSIVGIGCASTGISNMKKILVDHAGMEEDNFHAVDNVEDVPETMRADLEVPEIKEANLEKFIPTIKDLHSSIVAGIDKVGEGENTGKIPNLYGYYGVKTKENANVVLMGKYTPIYTEWQFGKGMVGTFACDLSGGWSEEFIESDVGAFIINNIVTSLFPAESIKPQVIDAEWTGDNYTTQLSVYTELAEGEYIEVRVTSPAYGANEYPTEHAPIIAGAADGYSRIMFSVTTPGIHKIVVQKKNAQNEPVGDPVTIYKPLSYSKEYDEFVDKKEAEKFAAFLAEASEGDVITDPWQIFQNAAKYLYNEIDPKIVFMIIVILFFLLDIAARKFKWKWPHEIIRDKKNKAAMSSK